MQQHFKFFCKYWPDDGLLRAKLVSYIDMKRYMIYLLTTIWLPPSGNCTVHIYTHTQYTERHKNFENNTTILEECGPCPDLASYTLAFALQLRKKHGKTCQGSRRVPAGMMKIHKHTTGIRRHNKNT